ncbi:hypothetical protein SM124_17790 [Bacillus sp. 31A1R]|uniref:Lipoprotein n=1 Tax=Robertmurraya mangrovi TaxID=3098077 RepID=A0ABU5J2D8_9BACI|nr:hypothetical protein [Bacillus sp. 31A1R]MDZ5473571.1 hypothetical protein [Bacillus sp. 31A1R]
MRKLIFLTLSVLFVLSFATCSMAANKFSLNKNWVFKLEDSSFYEKRIYHVTKEQYSVYILSDGEGFAKMLTLNPTGKKVWEKELRSSFAISNNTTPALFLIEDGNIQKYYLNSGKKLLDIKAPVADIHNTELYGVTKNQTLILLDWNTMNIVEIDEKGNTLSTVTYSDSALKKFSIQKPNMPNGTIQPSETIQNAIVKSYLPNFIKDKEVFQKKYGKGAKYFPYFEAKSSGAYVYVLAYFQINSTINNEIFSHSVLYKFKKTGRYISQKNLGNYNGTDIDVSKKGEVFVSLNNLNTASPYGLVKVINKKNSTIKTIKFKNQYVTEGKLYKNQFFIVTDKAFYSYK